MQAWKFLSISFIKSCTSTTWTCSTPEPPLQQPAVAGWTAPGRSWPSERQAIASSRWPARPCTPSWVWPQSLPPSHPAKEEYSMTNFLCKMQEGLDNSTETVKGGRQILIRDSVTWERPMIEMRMTLKIGAKANWSRDTFAKVAAKAFGTRSGVTTRSRVRYHPRITGAWKNQIYRNVDIHTSSHK